MFFTRCKDGSKKNNLYFASHLVRDIMDNNTEGKVKIINTGIKAFTKCENKGATCPYRLAQEGSLMTIPLMGARTLRVTLKDLQVLLQVSDTEMPPALNEMDVATQEQMEKLATGCIALLYDGKSLGKSQKNTP